MLTKANCLIFPCIPLVKDRFMTRQNRILCLALLCFALSGCADDAASVGKQGIASVEKAISLRATKGTPCAPQGNLAYAEPTTLLVCADSGGKGLVWKSAGIEVPVTEKGEVGKDCAKEGTLGRDAAGAFLYCGDESGQTP